MCVRAGRRLAHFAIDLFFRMINLVLLLSHLICENLPIQTDIPVENRRGAPWLAHPRTTLAFI